MSIKAIFLDLDGTLLSSDKQLPAKNRDALERAFRKGIHIVPATGRLFRGIPEALRDSGLVRYAVTVNGAKVYDAAEDRTLYRAEVDTETALRLLDRLEALGVTLDCYAKDQGYMDSRFYAKLDEYIPDPIICGMVRRMRTPVDDFRGFLSQRDSVQKMQSFFPTAQERDRARALLQPDFPQLIFSFSLPTNLEINHRDANKGAGLLALCRHLGISPKETMALGDECNDLPMLRAAGLGVAMGNASPEVKAEADAVTGTNDESGVAEAIERWAL